MSQNLQISPDQSVAQLTVSQLEALIKAVVRDTLRQEFHRDYYVNEHGVKVLYAAEEAAPDYLTQLEQDYEVIQKQKVKLIPSREVLQELGDLGVDV